LALNVPIKFSSTYIEGIDKIELDDFRFAREFGYKIKLLGVAERKKDSYEQRVHLCLVKEDSEIAKVENELNAVVIIDDMIGKTVLIGPGAGGKPTGAAIVADLIDLNRGNINLPLGSSISQSKKLKNINILNSSFAYFLKIVVKDEVGVMRRISDILARNKISIDQQKQEHSNKRGYAIIVIITHKIKEKIVLKAIKEINNMKRINNKVKFIRIEG
jgi:homoserine dehydrogenase